MIAAGVGVCMMFSWLLTAAFLGWLLCKLIPSFDPDIKSFGARLPFYIMLGWGVETALVLSLIFLLPLF